jgi:hypothetical protein
MVAILLSIEFNDLPHAMRFGGTPKQFVDMFQKAMPHLLAAKHGPFIVNILVRGALRTDPEALGGLRRVVGFLLRISRWRGGLGADVPSAFTSETIELLRVSAENILPNYGV